MEIHNSIMNIKNMHNYHMNPKILFICHHVARAAHASSRNQLSCLTQTSY